MLRPHGRREAYYGAEPGRLIMALCMCLAIGVAVIVYLVLVVLTRAVTFEDMKLIPKGEKLARLLHIRSEG